MKDFKILRKAGIARVKRPTYILTLKSGKKIFNRDMVEGNKKQWGLAHYMEKSKNRGK